MIEPSVEVLDSSADSEDVYFNFEHAAMCSMLHDRYTKIKNCALNQKDKVLQEITILQQLIVHHKEDKDHVSGHLKYHDQDHLYFLVQNCYLS